MDGCHVASSWLHPDWEAGSLERWDIGRVREGLKIMTLEAFRNHSWAANCQDLGAKEGLRTGILVC